MLKKQISTSSQVKIQFRAFSENKFFGVSMLKQVATFKDLSIDVSFTTVGLILTKLW